MKQPSNNRSRLGWVLFSVFAVLLATIHREAFGHSTVVYLGDYNLTTVEAVLVIVIISIVRATRWSLPRLNAATCLALVFCLVVGFGVMRGLLTNPLAALISLRATGVFAAFLILGLYLPKHDFPFAKIRFAIVAAAFVLVFLLILRMLFGPSLFFQTQFMSELEINDGGRGLAAPGAIVIAVAAALSLSATLRSLASKRRATRSATIFVFLLIGLLLTQQATAVIAGMSGMGAILALERGPARAPRVLIVSGLLAIAVASYVLAPGLLSTQTLGSLLPDWVAGDLVQRARNLYLRELLWNGLIADFNDWALLDKLLGLPAGVKPDVLVLHWGGVYWQASIHSMYFGTLPYAGIVGLVAYAGLLLMLAAGSLWRILLVGSKGENELSAALAVALCVILFVYGFSYELRNEQGMFLALAIVAAFPAKRAPAATDGGHPDAILVARLRA